MNSLVLIMPVYNEEAVIEEVIRDVYREIISKVDGSRMIVVNDGSRDSTPKILDKLAAEFEALEIYHKQNQGHGPAVYSGLEKAEGDYLFLMDSDGQYLPEDFHKLWKRRDEADLLIGMRKERHDPASRLLLTKVVRAILSILLGAKLRDANSPFKLMNNSLWTRLKPHIPNDCLIPSIFIAAGTKKIGRKVLEIPVTHLKRPVGQSHIRYFKLFKFCVKAFSQLIRFNVGKE